MAQRVKIIDMVLLLPSKSTLCCCLPLQITIGFLPNSYCAAISGLSKIMSQTYTTFLMHLSEAAQLKMLPGCWLYLLYLHLRFPLGVWRWTAAERATSESNPALYMDVMTTIATTNACTKRLLNKLQENIKWPRTEFKPRKSRSISIGRGRLVNERFHVNNKPILIVLEKRVKSLGRPQRHNPELRKDIVSGLNKINKTALPGKLKLWCFQFGLLPCLTLSHATRLQDQRNLRKIHLAPQPSAEVLGSCTWE